ncbi:unnamed protein product, partial [Didymodactylos carnosus]
LGLELVQELKQIEPYDYGNINHFLKDYIQDRCNAEKEYKYIKLIWGEDESENWEYLIDILVQFYEIDNQETNNWFQWKKLFIDKDFANDEDDDELVQISLFHKNEASNKSTISPKLFTSNLCVAVGYISSTIKTVTNQYSFQQFVRFCHNQDYQSFISNINVDFDNLDPETNSYSSILTIIYSSSIEVRLYAGLLLPTLFEHNLSFIFNNRTVLTGHVEASNTHDLLDNSNFNYAMTIIIINNLDIKCPHLGKLF